MKKMLLSTTMLFAVGFFTPVPAVADPITLAVVATASSVGAAYLAGAAISATVIFTHFAVNLAMGYVSQSLAPSMPKLGTLGGSGSVGASQSGYTVSGLSPVGDQAVIYGQAKVGGVIVYKEATESNKYLHIIVALAGHECQSIEKVYFNDEEITLDGDGEVTAPEKYVDKARVKIHLGSATQAADSFLISESDGKWTADHRLQGICYLYVRLEFDGDAYPNGEPSITALTKGKKIYNPNTGTTAWSANAALCLRDYLISPYGLATGTDEIDDARFITAANICDEDVALSGGGTQKRYESNGTFTTASKPKDAIDVLLRSMGGTIWYAQGKWRVKAAAYITPALTFDENDLVAGLTVSTRHSRRDNFNIVRGTFKGPESNFQPSDFPEIRSETFINVDGGQESAIDLDLGMTNTASCAQRIAKIALYRNRQQISVEGAFSIKAMQAQIGDIIQLTNSRLGFSNKTFEVVNWKFDINQESGFVVHMSLREISADVFNWDAEENSFEFDNTTLVDPFDVPEVGVSVISEARIINEHLTNVITVNVTTSFPERVNSVEVQYKKSTESEFITAGTGELGKFEVLDVLDADYDVRARAINTFQIKGAFTTISNFSVTGLAAPPANVTNFSFNVSQAGIHLEWTPVPDLDLSFYRIRQSDEESGATYANATTAVDKVPRPANTVTVPPKTGTYLIKAHDKSGNQSEAAASIVIRAADLLGYSNTTNSNQHTAFSGTKSGCSVDGASRLIITNPASAPSTATYTFNGYIDTSAVRVARVELLTKMIRIDNSAATFDTFTGLFDSLGGLFDDLSGGSSFADTNVIAYVSTTDDNPASSPTWSAYKRFKAGDFSGRAFRFKIDLESQSDNVTPALIELTGRVRYN